MFYIQTYLKLTIIFGVNAPDFVTGMDFLKSELERTFSNAQTDYYKMNFISAFKISWGFKNQITSIFITIYGAPLSYL